MTVPLGVPAPITVGRRLAAIARVYWVKGTVDLAQAFQYRALAITLVVSMSAEPIVSMVVWRTVAHENGGEVAGFTPARFAAYYIAWLFVRQASQMAGTEGFAEMVRSGELTKQLLVPASPIHQRTAGMYAWAVLLSLIAVPIAVALAVVFEPDFHTSPLQVVLFVVAVGGATTIAAGVCLAVSFTAFWLVTIRGLDRLIATIGIVISGRLVPVELLPYAARVVSSVLWFRWFWDFPITVLIGPITGRELLVGFAMQLGWALALRRAAAVLWRRGLRRYGAVGG